MPRKDNSKAPKIDVLSRYYLQLGLRAHPRVDEHVANIGDIEKMPMLKLMKLAKDMGVDPDALIESTEQHEHQRMDYSMRFPGFRGELEFDMTIAFLERSITRRAKVGFEHTPEWEYFDLRKQTPYVGREGTGYHIELRAVPEEYDGDDNPIEGKPYWVQIDDITKDDIVPHEMFDVLLNAVDETCKVEDGERRRLAAAQKAAIKSTSKRKH